MLDRMKERVNADAALIQRGSWVNLSFLLGIDDEDYVITIDKGRVTDIVPRRLSDPYRRLYDPGCTRHLGRALAAHT